MGRLPLSTSAISLVDEECSLVGENLLSDVIRSRDDVTGISDDVIGLLASSGESSSIFGAVLCWPVTVACSGVLLA